MGCVSARAKLITVCEEACSNARNQKVCNHPQCGDLTKFAVSVVIIWHATNDRQVPIGCTLPSSVVDECAELECSAFALFPAAAGSSMLDHFELSAQKRNVLLLVMHGMSKPDQLPVSPLSHSITA